MSKMNEFRPGFGLGGNDKRQRGSTEHEFDGTGLGLRARKASPGARLLNFNRAGGAHFGANLEDRTLGAEIVEKRIRHHQLSRRIRMHGILDEREVWIGLARREGQVV